MFDRWAELCHLLHALNRRITLSERCTFFSKFPGPLEPMIGKEKIGSPGPFEVRLDPLRDCAYPSFTSLATDETPRRRYDCANYDCCLELAAVLNWDSFTCRGCDGSANDSLVWRARHSARKDSVAKLLCKLPPVQRFTREEPGTPNDPR